MHTKLCSPTKLCITIAIPRYWISQLLVICSPNIEPLLCVEENTLWHILKMAAELTQHIATPLIDYSQMNKPTGVDKNSHRTKIKSHTHCDTCIIIWTRRERVCTNIIIITGNVHVLHNMYMHPHFSSEKTLRWWWP